MQNVFLTNHIADLVEEFLAESAARHLDWSDILHNCAVTLCNTLFFSSSARQYCIMNNGIVVANMLSYAISD